MKMKRKIRRKLTILAAFAGILVFATACGNQKGTGVNNGENVGGMVNNEVENKVDSNSTNKAEEGTITITDQNGMEVVIPENPSRLVTTALPLPSIYALTGAPIENLVGVHPGSTSAIENSVMAAMYPQLSGIADNFINGTDVNVEELLKLEPDVVLYWAEYLEQYEAMTNAGITAVGVKPQDNGNVLSTLESWLSIMGEIFGTTGNVEAVIAYGRKLEAEIAEKTAQIPEEDRRKVLYLYNHSEDDISVSGNGFYGQYWIDAAGGINVAADLNGATSVNMEQIYEWNPDIIIITTFTETMPEDLYNNTIDGQDWSHIDAVKNGKVYKEPLGVYRWFPPSGDAPLMLMWMANMLYPEVFDYDMKDEIEDYYERFYNYDLEDEQIEGILSANPEAAKGANFGGGASK